MDSRAIGLKGAAFMSRISKIEGVVKKKTKERPRPSAAFALCIIARYWEPLVHNGLNERLTAVVKRRKLIMVCIFFNERGCSSL